MEHNIAPVFVFLLYFIITWAVRQVKDSQRSGKFQSGFFGDKLGHAKSIGFRFESSFQRSESRTSSRYLEITSSSLTYSFTYSRNSKEATF